MFGRPLIGIFSLEKIMGQYSALSVTKQYRNICPVSKKVLSLETNPNAGVQMNSFANPNVWSVPNSNVLIRNNNGSKLCPVFHETL